MTDDLVPLADGAFASEPLGGPTAGVTWRTERMVCDSCANSRWMDCNMETGTPCSNCKHFCGGFSNDAGCHGTKRSWLDILISQAKDRLKSHGNTQLPDPSTRFYSAIKGISGQELANKPRLRPPELPPKIKRNVFAAFRYETPDIKPRLVHRPAPAPAPAPAGQYPQRPAPREYRFPREAPPPPPRPEYIYRSPPRASDATMAAYPPSMPQQFHPSPAGPAFPYYQPPQLSYSHGYQAPANGCFPVLSYGPPVYSYQPIPYYGPPTNSPAAPMYIFQSNHQPGLPQPTHPGSVYVFEQPVDPCGQRQMYTMGPAPVAHEYRPVENLGKRYRDDLEEAELYRRGVNDLGQRPARRSRADSVLQTAAADKAHQRRASSEGYYTVPSSPRGGTQD